MRGAALVLVCTAGCGGSGVDIEVYADSDKQLDRVELFLAYDECYADQGCANGIAWPEQDVRPDGRIFKFKDERRVIAEYKSELDAYVVHLDADTTEYADPTRMIAVGYRGSVAVAAKQLLDTHIPRNTVAIWQVHLDEAMPATTDVTTPPPIENDLWRVHTWPRTRATDPDLADCVVYQKWEETGWRTEYYVPESDPDCDGQPIECSPFWYDFNTSGDPSNCVQGDATVAKPCQVGHSLCADGKSDSRECMLNPDLGMRCFSDEICRRCDASIPVETCIAQAIESSTVAGTATMPYSLCRVLPELNSPSQTPCPGTRATLTLPSGGSACNRLLLHSLQSPIDSGNSGITLPLGPGSPTFKVLFGVRQDPCDIDLFWEAGSATTFTNGVAVIVEVGYANGNTIFYPLKIAPGNPITCAMQTAVTTCERSGPINDHMFSCTAAN